MKKRLFITAALCLSVNLGSSIAPANANEVINSMEMQQAIEEFNTDYAYSDILAGYQSDAENFVLNDMNTGIEQLKIEITSQLEEAKKQNQTQKVAILQDYLDSINYDLKTYTAAYDNLNGNVVLDNEFDIMLQMENSLNKIVGDSKQ